MDEEKDHSPQIPSGSQCYKSLKYFRRNYTRVNIFERKDQKPLLTQIANSTRLEDNFACPVCHIVHILPLHRNWRYNQYRTLSGNTHRVYSNHSRPRFHRECRQCRFQLANFFDPTESLKRERTPAEAMNGPLRPKTGLIHTRKSASLMSKKYLTRCWENRVNKASKEERNIQGKEKGQLLKSR